LISNETLSYFINKVYYRFVENLIETGNSDRYILEKLKKLELEKPSTTIKTIKHNIKYKFGLEWDDNKNIWKETSQVMMPIDEDEFSKNIFTDDLIATLSENATETILKDMKNISKDTKRIVKNIEKITENINELTKNIETVVRAISDKSKLE